MRALLIALVIAGSQAAAAAQSDDARPIIASQLQALMDATSAGDSAVWDRLLDPDCLYVEEDDTIKSKAEMVKENVPLPKGISGTIKVELLRFHQDGDVAWAVSRDHEKENYFGQALRGAEYLSTTTWRKETSGWKLIAAQVLAEPIDPPAISLPPAILADYAGTYRLKDSNMTYTIAGDGNGLHGTRAGRPATDLKPELKDVFFVAGQPRIRLIFQRDAAGHVIGYVSRREGRDVVWKKTG